MIRVFTLLMLVISLNCYAFHYNNSYSQGFNQGYSFDENGNISGPAPPHVAPPPIPGENSYVRGILEGQRYKNAEDHPGMIMDQATQQRIARKLKSLWTRR